MWVEDFAGIQEKVTDIDLPTFMLVKATYHPA